MDDVEWTQVSFSVLYESDSSNIVTSGQVTDISWFQLDEIDDLSGFQIDFEGVIDMDVWVWESDGSAVAGDDVWDVVGSHFLLGAFHQLEFGLLCLDALEDESAWHVVEYSEVLLGLVNLDHIFQ